MLWKHVDLTKRIWTIPSTKTETELQVPLSNAALDVLREIKARGTEPDAPVFPGADYSEPLSNAAMAAVLDRMNEREAGPVWVDPKQDNRPAVPHGFRSTFMDWAHECTNHPKIAIDMALAHTIDDKTEAAYRRGNLFVKRAKLMQVWGEVCRKTPISPAVIPFYRGA
jgi:integrase